MLLVTNMISHLGFQRRLQHLLHQPSQQTALASERHLVMSGLLDQPFSDQRQRRVRRQHQICRDLLDLIVFILHFMILPDPRQHVADRSQITNRLHKVCDSPTPWVASSRCHFNVFVLTRTFPEMGTRRWSGMLCEDRQEEMSDSTLLDVNLVGSRRQRT